MLDNTSTLDFWKVNEHKYPELSKLAKKFLNVQAPSASVERMFNYAGHICSNKYDHRMINNHSVVISFGFMITE